MLPLRLRRVSGLDSRVNDVLFQPAARPPPGDAARALVFFGGDVQDYPEVMQAHRDNRNYVRWNLENTARMLGTNFPGEHIVVVRPSRVEFKSFSCYDNFVPSNSAGVPDHTPTHSALLHLERLLQAASSRIKALPTSELLEAVAAAALPDDIDVEDLHTATIHHCMEHAGTGVAAGGGAGAGAGVGGGAAADRAHKPAADPLWWREALALHRAPLTLVGFSKGCVVLNQFIYEFHYTKTLTPGDEHMMRLIERISAMYWLDGGHAGGKNTWITARSLLETLARLDVRIYVHVSPYQVLDEARPWIGREEKAFTSLLNQLGAKVSRYLHGCASAPHTLHMHFHVLQHFHLARHTRERHADRDDDDDDDDDDEDDDDDSGGNDDDMDRNDEEDMERKDEDMERNDEDMELNDDNMDRNVEDVVRNDDDSGRKDDEMDRNKEDMDCKEEEMDRNDDDSGRNDVDSSRNKDNGRNDVDSSRNKDNGGRKDVDSGRNKDNSGRNDDDSGRKDVDSGRSKDNSGRNKD